MTYAFFTVCIISVAIILFFAFFAWLTFKERRELQNRIMCKSVDEYRKLVDSETKRVDVVSRESRHRQLIQNFRAKG